MLKVNHSCGHLLVITGYKWDYTFYKWGFLSTLSTYNWYFGPKKTAHFYRNSSQQPILEPGPCGFGEAFAARRLAGPRHPGTVGPRAADHRGIGAGRGAPDLRAAFVESIREPRSNVAKPGE